MDGSNIKRAKMKEDEGYWDCKRAPRKQWPAKRDIPSRAERCFLQPKCFACIHTLFNKPKMWTTIAKQWIHLCVAYFCKIKKTLFHIAALNPCSSSPCRNNGTCVPNEDGYRCNCPQGYSGSRCDQGDLSNMTHYDPLYNDLCDCIKSVLLASLQ